MHNFETAHLENELHKKKTACIFEIGKQGETLQILAHFLGPSFRLVCSKPEFYSRFEMYNV